MACLLSSPRAWARDWPIIDTASDALVITPSVPLASDFTRFAWRSSKNMAAR